MRRLSNNPLKTQTSQILASLICLDHSYPPSYLPLNFSFNSCLNKYVSLRRKTPTADTSEIETDSHVRNHQYGKRPETQLVFEFCFLASSLGVDHHQSKMVPRTSQWSEVKRSPCLEPFSILINPGSCRISQCCGVPGSLL